MTASARPPVFCLMGPTCSGTTALAMALVERFPLDIINVDSALVYEGLNIGAARPTEAELARAPHRLMGFRDPAEPYSAAAFRADALAEIGQIHQQGRIPLLVGGTMLYFRALLKGLAPLPAADPAVRAVLEQEAAEQGWPALHRQLAAVDAETAARLQPNDGQRIQRALEVYRLTGEPLSEWHRRQPDEGLSDSHDSAADPFPFTVVSMALAPATRAQLHSRIAERFRGMLDDGLVDEVRQLRQRPGIHPGLPSMKAVGYRQVWDYLDGRYDYDEMVERGIIATRQLAKRQFTWLRGWSDLHWFDSDDPDLVDAASSLLAPWVEAWDGQC